MGIYFQTVRGMAADNVPAPLKPPRRDPLYVGTGWWEELASFLRERGPQVAPLLDRFEGPVNLWTVHPSYQDRYSVPVAVLWNAAECRELFSLLVKVSEDQTDPDRDIWQFMSLVCLGTVEEGIAAY